MEQIKDFYNIIIETNNNNSLNEHTFFQIIKLWYNNIFTIKTKYDNSLITLNANNFIMNKDIYVFNYMTGYKIEQTEKIEKDDINKRLIISNNNNVFKYLCLKFHSLNERHINFKNVLNKHNKRIFGLILMFYVRINASLTLNTNFFGEYFINEVNKLCGDDFILNRNKKIVCISVLDDKPYTYQIGYRYLLFDKKDNLISVNTISDINDDPDL